MTENSVSLRRIYCDIDLTVDAVLTHKAMELGLSKKQTLQKMILDFCQPQPKKRGKHGTHKKTKKG